MPSLPRNLFLALFLVTVPGMLFIGLYPFNYRPTNQVSWIEDEKGIRFDERGQAVVTVGSDWPWEGYTGEPFTVELALRPSRTYNRRIPHIMALCDRSGREVAYFGQWKDSFIIRLMDNTSWIKKISREIGAGNLLIPGVKTLLTLVFNNNSVELYSGGKRVRRYDNLDLIPFMMNGPVRTIIFGNSAAGDSPWKGDILGFSVIKGKLDPNTVRDRYASWFGDGNGSPTDDDNMLILYKFDNHNGRKIPNIAGESWHLLLPETLTPVRREFLSLPSRQFLQKRSFYEDAAINLFGFVPMGLILMGLLSRERKMRFTGSMMLAISGGALLSLLIEVNQVFLVSRSSSATDLLLNILGTVLGVVLYKWGMKTAAHPPSLTSIE